MIGAPLTHHLAAMRATRRLTCFVIIQVLAYGAWLASFVPLLRWMADPRQGQGWFVAWLLALATGAGARWIAFHLGSGLAIDLAGLMRERALAALLVVPPRTIHQQGLGRLFSCLLDLGSAEAEGTRGLFLVVVAALELAVVAAGLWVFGSTFHAALLLAYIGLLGGLGGWYALARRRWNDERLAMSHTLVEHVVGYASCLVQRDAGARLAADDRRLAGYLTSSCEVDRRALVLTGGLPRGWLLLAVAALAPLLSSGASTPELPATLAGILLAYRALGPLSEGVVAVADARVLWANVRPNLEMGSSEPAPERRARPSRPTAIELDHLAVQVERRVLIDNVTAIIEPGDKIWLHGASGAGKSTLGRVLAGLEAPAAGQVRAGIEDASSAGLEEWRTHVAYAAQFATNHVFQGSLAFNLLLARAWPPSRADLAEAEQLCAALGLSDLLARMPGGLSTVVGETGWQLSHGERARLFIARALLQGAGTVVLDESLAALDPESRTEVLAVLGRRPEAIVLIAHP